MRRRNILIAGGVSLLGLAVWLFPQALATSRPLADVIPGGALLYLESKDLAALVRDWNGSAEKKAWVASPNFQEFSRSRLFFRLGEAQKEFATTAGLPVDLSLLDAAAGGNSALALYDIGNLELLYVTRMPTARAYTTALWQSRAKFQPRESAGIPYYVKRDQQRLAAFAVTNDYLLIATQEQAMASALALIAGQARPKMNQERWFDESVRAAQGQAGEVRMVINFERVRTTPYFRSYWVHQNQTDLRQYASVISDVERSGAEIRERRVLLRAEPGADRRAAEAAIGQLVRLAPADAGLYRAWAAPSAGEAVALVREKLFGTTTYSPVAPKFAPAVAGEYNAGTEEDLESRIDEAPVTRESNVVDLSALQNLVTAANPEALLEVQTSRALANGVFVDTPSAVAILAPAAWNIEGVRSALESAAASQWTISKLGAGWAERRSGSVTYSALSGLGRLAIFANGRVLIVSNSEELLVAMASRLNTPVAPGGATYAARYLHSRELPNNERLMRLVDHPSTVNAQADGRPPLFFSENLASLGRALGRLESLSIESHDTGASVNQTLVYRMR